MQQFGGKDSKRHFTVVMGGKEHGLYVSSTPSSAARKAVTKLCAANKSKKVQFEIREITQGSKKKTYGPYLGHIEKLKEPIKLEGRVIKYKPVAKIAGKRSEMKGGVSEFNTNAKGNRESYPWRKTGSMENYPWRKNEAIVKMFENFKVKNQADPFHYKKRLLQPNTLYFGDSYLLNINNEKYYPFSIHFIENYPYIRFFISEKDYHLFFNKNLFKDIVQKSIEDKGKESMYIYKHTEHQYNSYRHYNKPLSKNVIIQFNGSSLLNLLERLHNQILHIPIPDYILVFKELIEKYSSSLSSIIDLINKSDKDKNLISIIQKELENNLKNLNDKIISIKKNHEQKFYNEEHKKELNRINEEHKKELNIKFGREFEEKIKEIISRDDTNKDMKKLLQEIIDLTDKNENTKKGMYFNKNNITWKYHNKAYQYIHNQIKNEYIDLKKKDQERDGIDIIKELLNKYINALTSLKEKNTERSLFTKNNTNISLFISQKEEASLARAKAEYKAKQNELDLIWEVEGRYGPRPIAR